MNHFEKSLIILAAGSLLALGYACSPTEKEKPAKPNIIFIMTDDHAFQTLSAYDDRYINTPNLDRIAEHGAIFTNSFVANSICAPSRAVMLTGKHSHANGQIDNSTSFDGSQQTFPKLLRQNGYQTALIGKWHLKSEPTGFDYWNILPGQGSYYNPDFIGKDGTQQYKGYVTDLITDFSIDWLDQHNQEDPFCLLVHHKAVHRVWMPDTAHLDEFADKTYPLPDNFYDDYEGRKAAAEQHLSIRTEDMDVVYDLKMADQEGDIETRLSNAYRNGAYARLNPEQKAKWDAHFDPIIEDFKKANLSGKNLSEWKYQRYMRDYLACVRSLDNNVGRLMDYLEQEGLLENTLVVYTSDQGFYMGEHGWFDKRFIYEESLRTPLLMHFPKGYSDKGQIPQLVQNIDYAPTFLDMAGIEIPGDMHGRSLVPLFGNNNPENWRDAIYYHYYEFPNEHMVKRHYGIRTHRYKLIHFYYDIDQWELYDLKNDPHEMQNLIDDPEYQDEIKRLKKELKELIIKYNDHKALKIFEGEMEVTE
ncbi:sulfatase family protein [Marinilabilia rubra]|uniref:Sulfatase n=1 Tax=Marinilabilia rubra TaxID=2162893 RepID=A0A2U2BBE3_9BACT|nr:sulfatase [Marinilabilia rubra]PWE00394.1 sulfatase [Marinilabilia rubra]